MAIRASILIAAIALTTFANGSAQEPMKPALTPRTITATKQVAMFTGMETQLLQAIQKKDKAAAQAMLSDDLMIEMPDANSMPGEDWLDSVMSKDFVLEKFGVRQMSVVDLGNAAIVKYARLQQATQKGANENGQFFVVDVWKKNGDTWKLADRYVSKVSSDLPPQTAPKPTGKQ